MEINNDTILCFSGTGNSLKVANDINSILGGIEVMQITELKEEGEIVINSNILGIVFPVYYSRPPLIVNEIVNRMRFKRNTYIFAVSTYAGISSDVLKRLGLKLNSGFQVRMPGNNIFSHGAMPTVYQSWLFEREEIRVKEISMTIANKVDGKFDKGNILFGILDKATTKITDKIMNDFHYRDNKFWVNDKCIRCGICINICPVNNIELINDKFVWKNKCEQCTACIQYCPGEAIQWGDKTQGRKRYKVK